ncbi:MAG: hypothetical protein QM770_05960 [Tepidisphaeraceae bacterium]
MTKLTRERKVLLAVLGLGMAVLVWDQLSGGHQPQVAAAEVLPDEPLSASAETVPDDIARSVVADRLEKLKQQLPGQLALASPFTGDDVADASETTADVAEGSGPHPQKATAVVLSGASSGAVIDGRFVRLGELSTGYRLIAVERDAVTLTRGNDKLRLPLTN